MFSSGFEKTAIKRIIAPISRGIGKVLGGVLGGGHAAASRQAKAISRGVEEAKKQLDAGSAAGSKAYRTAYAELSRAGTEKPTLGASLAAHKKSTDVAKAREAIIERAKKMQQKRTPFAVRHPITTGLLTYGLARAAFGDDSKPEPPPEVYYNR